jgi:hypothetical protein
MHRLSAYVGFLVGQAAIAPVRATRQVPVRAEPHPTRSFAKRHTLLAVTPNSIISRGRNQQQTNHRCENDRAYQIPQKTKRLAHAEHANQEGE